MASMSYLRVVREMKSDMKMSHLNLQYCIIGTPHVGLCFMVSHWTLAINRITPLYHTPISHLILSPPVMSPLSSLVTITWYLPHWLGGLCSLMRLLFRQLQVINMALEETGDKIWWFYFHSIWLWWGCVLLSQDAVFWELIFGNMARCI